MKEITEREPDYQRYIAPQKEFADAVIGIDYSEFGQDLGLERNVYRITLSQSRMNHAMEDIGLSLDLYSILSLSQRNFSLKFLTSDQNNHRIGQLVMDGELRKDVGEKLEHSIENQTRIHPISIFRHRDYVPAGDLAQLILCWRIIHRRIFMETCR
jgi:phosphoribulokinase